MAKMENEKMFGLRKKTAFQKNVALIDKQSRKKLNLLQKRNLTLGFDHIQTLAAKADYHRLLRNLYETQWKEASERLREAKLKGLDTSKIEIELEKLEEREKEEDHIYGTVVKKFKKAAEVRTTPN